MAQVWREACGIFGVYAPGEDVARLTFYGLFALQHRGQESSGIATADGHHIHAHTGMGLVTQVFTERTMSRLGGLIAIGHNRYSTTGSNRLANAQPVLVDGPQDSLALAHNGNIINALSLRQELEEQGIVFRSSTDSEVIAHLILAAPGRDLPAKIRYASNRLQGAYSLAILTPDSVVGVRDPLGVRPLCIGRMDGGHVFASESCAMDHVGAEFVREVEPGEIVVINGDGVSSYPGESTGRALCVFEYIYFARPDSVIGGKLLYPCREAMGRHLAREYPVAADLIMGVPDSATAAGIGYSNESGLTYTEGLIKNRYVGRTFIEPAQRIRELGVRLKFNPLPQVLEGKRVVVVDDSIVRGTTTPRVVAMLRRAGAREVHLRISSPPICHPCFFGVDMARHYELIAARKSIQEIQEFVGADSLGYLSLEGLISSVGLPQKNFCVACFTGDYPIPVQLEMDKLSLETTSPERA
ncbi:MAG: amidophosphoribosyltransferase [Dehalococcoidia bacterium]|jgi:amidophosphoribosyltransferase|nr:amidophosphoribosyltransferase [Dehalococcoidia bacterium]MDP7240486.1 amidophosphoribosyltransferase [Dehalococcoidia bacterium]